MDIGTLIKTIRISRGVTQKVFSERLDISTNYLCLIEKGNRKPSDEVISKIADSFGISKEALSFICTSVPQELDSENSIKYQKLQENIASLILFSKNKVA